MYFSLSNRQNSEGVLFAFGFLGSITALALNFFAEPRARLVVKLMRK